MKIICAPDKFKGSLSAPPAAEAMARGIRGVRPDAEVDLCPVADGGEGTVEALVSAQSGRFYTTTVAGPRQQPVSARWGVYDRAQGRSVAVIEMAQAAARTGVPTIALAGSAGDGAEQVLRHGLKAYHVIGAGLALEESIRHAEELLEKTTARVVREWLTQRDQ